MFKDTKVGERFVYADGSKSPGLFPQTPPPDIVLSSPGGGL